MERKKNYRRSEKDDGNEKKNWKRKNMKRKGKWKYLKKN